MKAKSLSPVRLFATAWTGSLPGSSVHGILQARILEWVAISFSRGSSHIPQMVHNNYLGLVLEFCSVLNVSFKYQH